MKQQRNSRMIPYGRHKVCEEDIDAVLKVLRSEFLTQGPCVREFERETARRVGAGFGVATNSATSALHIACMAIGLKEGDYGWTSPITFVASANCIRYCGGNVGLVDIDPMTGLMDVDKLEEKLIKAERTGHLPKVIIPVHLSGASCNMHRIWCLGEKYGFKIVEDASHAIGGTYRGEAVGKCRYSDITVFSFHPVKIITSAEGGMAVTNNEGLADRMRRLASHGITRYKNDFANEEATPWQYEQKELGFNYRMSDVHAALGLSQLGRLTEVVGERQRLTEKYRELFGDIPIKLLSVPEDTSSACHLAIARVIGKKKDEYMRIFRELRKSGIMVQLHYRPVHFQPYYGKLNAIGAELEEAEAYAESAISLPLYPGLTEEEVEYVVKTLRSVL